MSKYSIPLDFIGKIWLPDPIDNRHVVSDDKDYFLTLNESRLGLPDGRVIIVPEGFKYDKASVPRAVWWYIPRDDAQIEQAAKFHDWLYENQKIEGEWMTRKEADQIFLKILKSEGMRWSKRRMVYLAVRSGGWIGFNKLAKEIENPIA